jgi:hypothetical protein
MITRFAPTGARVIVDFKKLNISSMAVREAAGRCRKWFSVSADPPYSGKGREKKKETIPFISFPVPAYLRRGYYNVILVDWSKLAVLPWYVTAVRNAKVLGPYLARVMSWLDAHKAVPLSKIHVIGFSLGAEAAGFMGKALAPRKVRQRRKARRVSNYIIAHRGAG